MGTPEAFAAYSEARLEHAWLLRAEGLTYREIGQHLGVCKQQAASLVAKFSRRVQSAIDRQRRRCEFTCAMHHWVNTKQQAEADRWIEAWTTQ